MTSPVDSPRPSDRSPVAGVVPAEWPAHAADLIVDNIAKVRDKTTKPALVASRGMVFGLVAAIIGSIGLVLLVIGMVRLLSNYLPGDQVWHLYAVLFVVFTASGLVLLRKAVRASAVPAS